MPVTAAICWTIHPDGTKSVIDFLEMPVTLWEAPHYYNRYWGQHGVHDGPVDFSPRYDTPSGLFYPFLRYID